MGAPATSRSRWRSSSTSTRPHPEPPLLPADALGRARVRALAQDIACEIHPLNNLRVLRYLQRELGARRRQERWLRHWIENGLDAVERQFAGHAATGRFCHGDTPTLADCMLVPQIFNAQRFDCRLDHVPTVMRVFDAAWPARVRGAQPWPAPTRTDRLERRLAGARRRVAGCGALMTTRDGGASGGPFAAMNCGAAVGDDAGGVAANRRSSREAIGAAPVFLRQVHGTRVVRIGGRCRARRAARGRREHHHRAGVACTVLVADCLPVLFATPRSARRGRRARRLARAGRRRAGGRAAAVCEAAIAHPATSSPGSAPASARTRSRSATTC